MMNNLFKKLPFVLSLVLATGLILSSCGDDGEEPTGGASNEMFIGDYIGEVQCAGLLATIITEPTLSFTVTNTDPPSDNMVSVNLPIPDFPLNLVGTVSGNTVSMEETTVEDVEANGIVVDVTASGNATLTGNSLAGTIDLIARTPAGAQLATDQCTITATKQ